MTLQIGNALDLLRGHGGDNRETKSKWGNLTLTPAKLKLIATFIEQRGVKDGLELVGHHGKLLSIHPTLLCLITEVYDLDGSYITNGVSLLQTTQGVWNYSNYEYTFLSLQSSDDSSTLVCVPSFP